jgi:hypothetical protein
MLPPVKGVVPDITSPYGDTNRPEGSSNPHGGVDFDYLGGQNALNQSHQGVRSPVDGIVENAGAGTAGRIAIRDKKASYTKSFTPIRGMYRWAIRSSLDN